MTLPNGAVEVFPLSRLTRLYDTLEQLEDILDEGLSVHDEEDMEEVMGDDGNWHTHQTESDAEDWEDDEDMMDVDDDWPEDETGSTATADTQPNGDWWDDEAPASGSIVPSPGPSTSPEPSSTACSPSPEVAKDLPENLDGRTGISQQDSDAESPWKRFDVVAEAPPDHAFFSTPVAQPSRQFLARLQKEYRALTNSLPGMR